MNRTLTSAPADPITVVGDEKVSRCPSCIRLVRLHWDTCPSCGVTLPHVGAEWLYHKTWLPAVPAESRPPFWQRVKSAFGR